MYFPIFLDLRSKEVLVIGGDEEATRKAESLVEAGARVTVLSKAPTPKLVILSKKKVIKLLKKDAFDTIISKFFLVIVSTKDKKLKENVANSCFERDQLVNVLDDPQYSNYIFPSTFKEGPLQVAVSTGGASPALAKHIRKKIQKEWGKSWGSFLGFMQDNRKKVMTTVNDPKLRKKLFENAGSKKVVEFLNSGKVQAAKAEFKKQYEKLVKKDSKVKKKK